MNVLEKTETQSKAVISASEMCRLLKMSRSQFYAHIKRGTFHQPLHLPSNNRPYYTAGMVQENLSARQSGIGVNGEFVLFYERQSEARQKQAADHSTLIDGLKTLGIHGITDSQVSSALAATFPNGTADQDQSNVLRTVFRHLKRSGTV